MLSATIIDLVISQIVSDLIVIQIDNGNSQSP
jgi:hypothetical protein